MKKSLGFMMVIAALVLFLAWTGQIQAYEVRGDVTSGWGTLGGDLWYDVLKETATSTAGQYDDVGDNPYGVIVRPPTTQSSPNPLSPTNHNWIQVNYLLITGKKGGTALYSVGEMDPRFGNQPVTITCTNGKKNGRSCDKTSHCDLTGAGRSVKDVSTIDVVHAFTNIKSVPKDVHPYSPMLVVSGVGITPKSYDLADLQAMNQVTFDASTSTSNTQGIWKGPRLVDVLKKAGVNTRDVDSYVIVQATDGYATLISMYEATQLTGPQYAMLAISGVAPVTVNGETKWLETINCSLNGGTCAKGDGGFVRFALPNDLAAGRWVSNTAQIIVYKLYPQGYRW